VVQKIYGGTETTCRSCGRHPTSPKVEHRAAPVHVADYTPPWSTGHGRPVATMGKRKAAKMRGRT